MRDVRMPFSHVCPVMSTHTIRQATPADAAAIAPLFDAYRQFYEQPADAALALDFISQRLARSQSVILLAEDAQTKLQGFCQLYPTLCSVAAAPIYALYDLYVSPSARQHGTGRRLLEAAHALAKAHGMVRMDLTTAKTNLPAQSLYESLGWVRDEVFYAYNLTVG
jgi:ribosomal protein S18 acetylase RimI-like enzyme